MKKIYTILAALLTVSMSAKDLTGIRFYVNPGHGSFGTNDRPAATIPFPNLKTTGMPDTCGFYESNTNLWKCLYLGEKLEAAGATVLYSRTQCGPWPYTMVDGDYPDYKFIKNGTIQDPIIGWQYSDGYQAHPDYEKYNRNLVEITEEVEANNIDYFISVHSNASTEGTTTNFPLMLYRGPDDRATANATDGYEYVEGSYEKAKFCNEEKLKIMKAGIDVASSTNIYIRGDWDFYGSSSNRTHANDKTYKGYLSVLKHGASGFLSEGYFHTYQPARHRALNQDYCHMEGLDYYRGIINYYGADKETVGYIVGTVKDQYNKMSNNLYTYTPNSNDQWVPCNGAEVILKKGGVEVARYNVDTMYNGIFVFEGLEPGDDYSLDANCEGFFPLADQYKVPFSVKANETTYPMIYLVDTAYVPEEIVYEDYPNPDQPAYLGLPSAFEMTEQAVRDYTEVIKGTVKRTLQSGDSTILLSHEEDGTPHIYLIKSSLNTIETISTDSLLPRDPDNLGDYLALSDIALTCDGKLVGVNYVRCQHSDDQVDAGYKRGTKYFYIWDKLAGEARIWFTAQDGANSYRSDVGYTLAVRGESKDCQVLVSARHYNATSGGTFRYSCYTVTDGVPSYIFYGHSIALDENPVHNGTRDGENIQFTLSPRGEKKDFIMDADKVTPNEFRLPGGQNQDVEILGQIPAELMHVKFNGATYFKYAGKALMAAPATDAEGKVTGIQVLDITDGLDVAKVIKTTNTTWAEPIEATYSAATAKVKGSDLYLYLLVDNKMYSFTTVGVAQPVVPSIVAYNLNVTAEGTNYVFTFDANADAVAAELVFYAAGEEVGVVPVEVVKGANAITVAFNTLPGAEGQELTWAVKLDGGAIANFGIIASEGSLIESSTSRLFNAVSTNPELDNFGKIYIMHRAGSSSSATALKSGIWEYDHNLVKTHTEVYKGGEEKFGNPTRMSMDREGYLYIADWADGHSGIFMANTADMTQPFTQFFAGTRESNGAFNNGGVYTGSSTPGCYVYDNGEEVKLFVYNEDAKGTLPANGIAVYNIGQEDGTILHSWETAPSAVYTLTGQANTEGNPWGTSHGFFVSQARPSGNNNSGATSLKFYSNDGTEQMSSASDEYKEIITGSNAGGYVVSADESVMVFNDGDTQFLVFDITWEGDKPVMALRYTIKHGISAIRQMNWDYAGNIVCSGDEGIHIVSLPKDENITIVPAKNALTVVVGSVAEPNTITYELNGGVTNDYGWMSKNDMFQSCMADAGVTGLPSLAELKEQADPFAPITGPFGANNAQTILDSEKWDWLETYIMSVQNADNTATALTEGVSSASWRYAIAAFFLEMQRASWPKSADFSRAGKYEAFQPAWKHGFANPTEPTSDWVLNAPYKEGYTFVGWYTTPDFSGNKVTTINTSTAGTLYAKWRDYTPTIAEVKALAVNTQTKLSGVVTFIDGKNVYIQDITGGILLSMAANPTFTVSQSVIVQGTKELYGGAPQLQGCVEVSSEAGTMPDPIVFEDLNELINDTELKYCAQLVKVHGLTITEYDNYNNPTFSDGIRPAKGDNMVLDPTVFPLGSRVVVTAIADYYDGFRFVGDIAGIEKAIADKKEAYTYPVRNDKYALTNNWVVSVVEDNYAANKPGSSVTVRGMAAKDGIMYFINRETESLVRVDAATGTMLEPLKITGDHLFQVQGEDGTYKDAVTYKFNDLKFDNAGNCLIGAIVSSGTKCQPFIVYSVNLETGVATELINDVLWDNPDIDGIQFRFDAFGVYGDVTKNGVVMAASASDSWNVFRWQIKNGVVGKGELISIQLDPERDNYLASTATSFGTAPQIAPQDEEGTLFYVDGNSTLPMLFDEDGTLIDDFINCPHGTTVQNNEGETTTLHTGLNGLQEFQVGNEYFLVMVATHTISTPPSAFALYKFADEMRTFDGLEPLWYFPNDGLGSAMNGCRTAVPSVEVSGNTATISIYAVDNGYASYTFTVDDSDAPIRTEETATACDSYTWNGKTYTQSGTYTFTTTAVNGNDSIVTLHLTISPILYTEETISACDSYVWNGQTYTQSGDYTYTTTATNGCDSIVTLHLTINYSEVGETENVTICHGETYTWNGQTYSTAGEYSITLPNTSGCDSVVTLQLTILPEMLTTEEYVAICHGETYTWNGQDYATAGAYTANLSSVLGCDSTAILHLTVLPEVIRKTEYISAPTNKTVNWRGKEYNETGIYYDTVHFVVNPLCDSVIYMLDLTIADNIDSDKYCGDNLTWYYSNGALIITGSGAMYDDPDRLTYRDESWYPARVNNIVLPEAITHIGNVAFADCANLTNIVIPNKVTSIGDGAFSWTGLQAITIPASVTDLGEQVFEACNGLHTVLYESEPRSISNQTIHPFIGCVHLDTIIAPAALWHCTTADPALEARYGVPHKARYIEVTDGELTNQAIRYIANNSGAMEILDLTNATNTTLPYGAWSNNYQLSTLYLPQQIEVIPESMVEGARNLSEIAIPATVMEIGNYAFAGCVNVWRMTVEAVIPPKVYENTFDGISRSISVQVPAGSEELYREAAYWSEFFIEHTNNPSPITNCHKLLRKDQILILRNGKVYTTMGQLVNTEE